MADIFLSYSRRNADFTRRLFENLRQTGRDSWVDWEGIPLSADWWKQIQKGIESSTTFILIASPDSLASPVCNLEIAYAISCGKRIVPVIYKQPEQDAMLAAIAAVRPDDILQQMLGGRDLLAIARNNWLTIGHINWLFFRDEDDFDTAYRQLLETLDTDLDHSETHTRLLVRARQWEEGNRSSDRLLIGEEITAAEAWLANAGEKKPTPTALQRDYIQQSRIMENRRRRLLRNLRLATVGLAVVGVAALISTAVAGITAHNAQQDASIAQAAVVVANTQVSQAGQTLTPIPSTLTPIPITLTYIGQQIKDGQQQIESLRLAGQANTALGGDSPNAETSALLAIRGLRSAYTPQADAALVRAVAGLSNNRVFGSDQSPIVYANYSPDGTRLALLDDKQTVTLWDLTTNQAMFTLPDAEYDYVGFSPDGQQLVSSTGAGGYIKLWDLTTRKLIFELHLDNNDFYQISNPVFTSDGKYIAFIYGYLSSEGVVRVYDTASGQQVFEGDADKSLGTGVETMALSPNGTLIAASAQKVVYVFDFAAKKTLFTLAEHTDDVDSVAFSPDGSTIASGSRDNTVKLWNAKTGKSIKTLEGHTDWVEKVVFSPDGKTLASGSMDKTVRLWNVQTGQILYSLDHTDVIYNATFSPDGQTLLTWTSQAPIYLWDVGTGKQIGTLTGFTNYPANAAIMPDGKTVFSIADKTVRLWSLKSDSPDLVMDDYTPIGQDAIFSPDGATALSSEIGKATLWNLATRRALYSVQTTTNSSLLAMKFSPDSSLFAIADSMDITQVYDRQSGQRLYTAPGTSARFSNDGTMLVTVSLTQQAVILSDAKTGNELHRFRYSKKFQADAILSPDNKTLYLGDPSDTIGNVQGEFWDVASGKLLVSMEKTVYMPSVIGFSPDGKVFGISSAYGFFIWDVATGRVLQKFDGYAALDIMPFSPDSRYVATIQPDKVVVYDVSSGKEAFELTGDSAKISSVEFSPDGNYIVTASEDATGRVWDAKTGTLIRVLTGHTAGLRSARFSPDSRWIITTSDDKTLRLWQTNYQDFIDYACQHITRELTPAEKKTYGVVGDTPTCPASTTPG